jgi:hypothetical protein
MFFAPAICFHDVRTRLLLGLFCAWLCASATAGQPRLVVDTEAQTLTVILTDRPLLTLHDLSIGRYGTTLEKRRGDGRTPLGQFRVTDVKRDSAFHRFIALSYPDAERAARGSRVISARASCGRSSRRIEKASRRRRTLSLEAASGSTVSARRTRRCTER